MLIMAKKMVLYVSVKDRKGAIEVKVEDRWNVKVDEFRRR